MRERTSPTFRSIWTFDDPRSFGARAIVSGFTGGLRSLGCDVCITPLDPEAPDGSEALRRGLEASSPDLLLFVNQPSAVYLTQMGFSSAQQEAMDVPRLVWMLDDPFIRGADAFGPRDVVVAADPGFIPVLKARGAGDVFYLPVAADRFEPGVRQERFASPVAYVGSVMDMSAWRGQLPEPVANYLDTIVDRRLDDPGLTFDELLNAHPLTESKRLNLDGPLAYYLYVVANTRHRIRMLETLTPYGLEIYGNQDWHTVLPERSKLRDVLHSTVDPQREFPDLAVSTEININLRSLQGFASPTQRDFIVPGFGGFMLSSSRHAADEMERVVAGQWEGLESPTAKTPEALAQSVGDWLERPNDRRDWIESRRETISARHLYRHRASTALRILADSVCASQAANAETEPPDGTNPH